MKTPWSELLKYGLGVTTLIVGCICGLIVLTVIGLLIGIAKLLVFIK